MSGKIAYAASGTGSLFEAACQQGPKLDLLIVDRPCRAFDVVAPQYGVHSVMRRRTNFGSSFDRRAYTLEILEVLREHSIDLLVMAGFMTVLDKVMFEDRYKNRVLNTHPSLLPSFKGDHAVRDALQFGVKLTGCTFHVATEKLDDGLILFQQAVEVEENDTEDSLWERIKEVERENYRRVAEEYLAGLPAAI